MKDDEICVQPPAEYNTVDSCRRKCKYEFKRRAIKDAHVLASKNPGMVFTVYACQWCNGYHIGRVHVE